MTIPVASRPRAGITLVEILISIFIMGVGLISLATLFPIGLLRLREAQRQTRSAYLVQSAAADVTARGLFYRDSFTYADLANAYGGYPFWYLSATDPSGRFNPLVQDTAYYTADPFDGTNPGANSMNSGGYGLPFAYDPLWRDQANGVGLYLYDNKPFYGSYPGGVAPEARFGSGIGFMRDDADGSPPSAHGLQRLTNFNRRDVMPSAYNVPGIFVSPEDMVWQEGAKQDYNVAWTTNPVATPSTVVPDLSMTYDAANNPTYQPSNDWRYSWMITAQQNNRSNGASFEGNIVIFENRPFATDIVAVTPTSNAVRVAGETVVEAVFGYSNNVVPNGGPGYGAGADRTVLLRWVNTQPDPVVKVGDWLADVTYERNANLVLSRFYSNPGPPPVAFPNPVNNFEWDNLPAQRCFWYQVQKVNPARDDPQVAGFRSMVVYVNRKLEARTLLDGSGLPVHQNAALLSPYIVNVIPQTFFIR